MTKKKSSGPKGRDPEKRSQTFWLHRDVVDQLDELSRISSYTKTDLVRHWIEEEFERQRKLGNLDKKRGPFEQ